MTRNTSFGWFQTTEASRVETVQRVLGEAFTVLRASDEGDVTVRFVAPMDAAERGTALLDAEDKLRAYVEPEIVLWHESLGDRSSLRNLRGIEIKA